MGQKQDISPEIIQDYQYAGAIHILSVSGLHIGFIFISFYSNQYLIPVKANKANSHPDFTIIICHNCWSGAISSSISHHVLLVAIGYHLRRSVNIYHTILVSVFLILFFQPSFLFDVFNWVTLLLFFIIWFQPLLASIWSQTKFVEYIWGILTVSFAAQIGTLPLSIYYFHHPGLF
jgi:competence protein ComEC